MFNEKGFEFDLEHDVGSINLQYPKTTVIKR